MTRVATAISEVVWRTGSLRVGTLRIRVQIMDVRDRWGQIEYLVEPMDGSGEQWVGANLIDLKKQGEQP